MRHDDGALRAVRRGYEGSRRRNGSRGRERRRRRLLLRRSALFQRDRHVADVFDRRRLGVEGDEGEGQQHNAVQDERARQRERITASRRAFDVAVRRRGAAHERALSPFLPRRTRPQRAFAG
ncbi:MAG TPA: hypothetical protein VFB22_04540 [Candidatus Baltobacteraceae bacterium]|nr:hypothetical protein [Candidatus Baltobacteraceae bacterium]